MGEGSKQAPVTIRFMPGRHIFKHGALMTGKPQISNTNDAPNEPKAMAIRLMEAKKHTPGGKAGSHRHPAGRKSHLCLHGTCGKRFPERPGF